MKKLLSLWVMVAFLAAQSFASIGESTEAKSGIDENDPASVIAKYIQAVGGEENVAKIKNSTMIMEASIQGATLVMKTVSDSENHRMMQQTAFMGNVASKTIYKDGKAKAMAMGQEQAIPDDMAEMLKIQTYAFPEAQYEAMGYKMEVQGTKKIKKEDAYKLVLTAPNGMKTTEYYSVESGLKLRTSSDTTGEITYQDYQEKDGVLVPMKLTIVSPMLPMELEAKVIQVTFNSNLSDADFN